MGKVIDTMIVQAAIGVTPNSMSEDKVFGRLRELYAEGWNLFASHLLSSNPRETSYSFVLVKYAPEKIEVKAKK